MSNRYDLWLCAALIGFIFICEIKVTVAHVSMTFPPARTFNLDFLNSFWTKPPCGMPKGGIIRTTLEAGKTFNATWHLGYAHNGGYRLELLDSSDNKVMDLTPTNDTDFYQAKTTAQWHLVDLPLNLTCYDCTIRLLRQVPEFAPNFAFWSCSDVDIVPKVRYTETCSGHGYQRAGSCSCYRGFWGERCQYEDECEKDNDCNLNGKCIYLGGSALPRKQCFCSSRYFGEKCSRSNPFSMPRDQTVDLSKYIKVPLAERITMYFKTIVGTRESDDEMEFILKINGTSYGGLGWRPVGLGPICKSWPFIADALTVEELKHEKKSSKTKRETSFTITKAEDQSDHFKDRLDKMKAKDHGQVRIGATSTSVTSSQSSVSTSHSAISNNNSPPRSISQHHQHHQQQHQPIYDIPVSVEKIPSTNSQSQSNPVVITIEQGSENPTSQEVHLTPEEIQQDQQHELPPPPDVPYRIPSEWSAQDAFSPMDCTDIIMGAARGRHSRIGDYYARGRHTPKLDWTWGGRDDLTGATGWEIDGETTLIFRRKVISTDGSDHDLHGEMLVIWARGQQPGETISNPNHQLERDIPTVSDFYTEDEYKYHGLGPQRGLLYIDFTAAKKESASRFI